MKASIGCLLLAVALCCWRTAAVDVYRLLQAEFSGQKIGSRTYSAEGVRMLPLAPEAIWNARTDVLLLAPSAVPDVEPTKRQNVQSGHSSACEQHDT